MHMVLTRFIPLVRMEDPAEAVQKISTRTQAELQQKHLVDLETVMEIMLAVVDLVGVRNLAVVVAVLVESALHQEQRLVVQAEVEQIYFHLG